MMRPEQAAQWRLSLRPIAWLVAVLALLISCVAWIFVVGYALAAIGIVLSGITRSRGPMAISVVAACIATIWLSNVLVG
jgi:hypothetical protein